MEELAKHGITLPPNMQGLAEEQISELNLHDEWEDECIPSGGVVENKDPLAKRNGKGMFWIVYYKILMIHGNTSNALSDWLHNCFTCEALLG